MSKRIAAIAMACALGVVAAAYPAATVHAEEIHTDMLGDQLMTYYSDMVVSYKTTATGKDGEMLAINGLKVVRSTGMDSLVINGTMLYSDGSNYGMSTFYADFYDVTGQLIKRQAVYALAPLSYETQYELTWYIPADCTLIVIE